MEWVDDDDDDDDDDGDSEDIAGEKEAGVLVCKIEDGGSRR